MQDWDLGPNIWRCMLCEYQWYTVDGLLTHDGHSICPLCELPITKLDRPPWYTKPVKYSVKAPPLSVLNQLPVTFGPIVGIVGPDDAAMSTVETTLSGQLS